MKPEKTPGKRNSKTGSKPETQIESSKTKPKQEKGSSLSKSKQGEPANEPILPAAILSAAKPANTPKATGKTKKTKSSVAKQQTDLPGMFGGESIEIPENLKASSAEQATAKPRSTRSKAKTTVEATPAKEVSTAAPIATPEATRQPKEPATRSKLNIPDILLEGDATPAPRAGGPGTRYALSHEAPALGSIFGEIGELPQSYGTKRLFLTARDPHWLYASWDLTHEQIRDLNKQASHGHLVIRVYENEIAGQAVTEVHVHPESQNWFIHVPKSETRYIAALGYYDKKQKWQQVSASRKTFAPPDSMAEETDVQFATISADVSFKMLIETVKTVLSENMPLVEAFHKAQEKGEIKGISFPKPGKRWTRSQEAELAKLITMDDLRRVWIGSLEITELLRRRLQQDVSSMAAAELARQAAAAALSSAAFSVSSPFGGEQQRGKSFWFNVNAELIIYGATEPDAKVTIGDKHIKLRPDGTFSFRFILPDGEYELPAVAVSRDGDDTREAQLRFSRHSEYRGDVQKHPQDPSMKPPKVENVA